MRRLELGLPVEVAASGGLRLKVTPSQPAASASFNIYTTGPHYAREPAAEAYRCSRSQRGRTKCSRCCCFSGCCCDGKRAEAPQCTGDTEKAMERCDAASLCACITPVLCHVLLQALVGWIPHLPTSDRPPPMGNALPPQQRQRRHRQRQRLQQKQASAKLLHTLTWGATCGIWMSGTTTWPISPKVFGFRVQKVQSRVVL
jgi:hypothetical protein